MLTQSISTIFEFEKKNNQKKRREKEVELNAFNKFCSLNVESSNEEDKPNEHAPAAADNDDSFASCLLSDGSNSNTE